MAQRTAEIEREIAERIAELHGDWYSRRPSNARAYSTGDVVVVLLEETFTPAEQGLIERAETEGIQDIRRRWQQIAKDDLVAIVTQITGRQVRSFVSDTDLVERIAIETFILGDHMQDMGGFEQASEGACDA